MAPVLHVEYAARRALRRQDRREEHQHQLSQQLAGSSVAAPHDDAFESELDSEDSDDDEEEEEVDGNEVEEDEVQGASGCAEMDRSECP